MTKESPQPPAISFEHVGKNFGDVQALKDVTFDVSLGEVVVVLGPSGSGKSTLCRCVNRLETIDEGTIRVEGDKIPEESAALSRFRTRVGMVFQSFNLFPHLTISENITLAPQLVKKVSKANAKARAESLLKRVGIADKADRFPGQLSGGQAQRAAIARALAMDPDILLFDEPTSALDPEMTKEVLGVMRDLASSGMTMLVVSHEMSFARRAADRIIFMEDGRVVEDTTPEVFFSGACSQRAKDFLNSMEV